MPKRSLLVSGWFVPRLRHPFPHALAVLIEGGTGFAIVDQPIKDRGHGSERILVVKQDAGELAVQLLADFAGRERLLGFYQHHAAGTGEAGLAAAALALHQAEELV